MSVWEIVAQIIKWGVPLVILYLHSRKEAARQ